jgi:hypothetical protein
MPPSPASRRRQGKLPIFPAAPCVPSSLLSALPLALPKQRRDRSPYSPTLRPTAPPVRPDRPAGAPTARLSSAPAATPAPTKPSAARSRTLPRAMHSHAPRTRPKKSTAPRTTPAATQAEPCAVRSSLE